jgi:uncharacterized protein (DUF305 family)
MAPQTDDLGELSFDQLMELERRAATGDGGGGDISDDDGDGDRGDDDAIVLPWWQHPMNIVTLVVTAAVLSVMTGWMIGDAGAGPRHNQIDTGFMQDMRLHHEQAIFMSFVYRDLPDTDPELRAIAASIVQGQSIEVGRMVQLLRDFGEDEARDLTEPGMTWMGMVASTDAMPGMASEDELDALIASSGEGADRLFVQLMSEHHLGGIEMAEFAAERGESDEVKRMAASMASAQRGEIYEMTSLID